MWKPPFCAVLVAAAVLALPSPAAAQASNQEWLCDSSTTNCRTPLLNLIAAETIGIDAGFWFMEDSRYATALVNAHNRGVRVRVLMDTKANTPYPGNATNLQRLSDGGIPMRRMTSSYLHWKLMLFAGQNVVQFGSANYSPFAFVYQERLVDFIDEAIYFSNDPSVVNSFKTKFDDAWVDTSRFTNYANVSGTPARAYPVFTIDPELSFPTASDFGSRSVGRYNAEPSSGGIDSMIFRITDRRHTDAIIAAHQRGVPVRIVTEPSQYRDSVRYMHAWNVDRLYAAGIPLRHRRHAGANHLKLTLLHGQRMSIFGSQNWTRVSGNAQYEHNYFTRKGWIYQWFVDRFERTWRSSTETQPFVPLPPSTPSYRSPANGAQIQSTGVTLRWWAGLWAHKYDIYFGTSSNPPLLAADVELGNSTSSSDDVTYAVTGLSGGTTYYWRIVSKTMANVARSGPVWSFHNGGSTTTSPLPSGWQSRDIGAVGQQGSASYSSGTFTLRGAGADVWGTSDAFHYAYRSLSGDGTITARVASIGGTQAWTKMGVMIRGSTTAGSAHAFMLVSSGKGLAFQRRTANGGTSTHTSGGSGTAPRWVRLARSGATITASVSTNGSSWTVVGRDTFSLPSTVLVGLVAHSHTTSALATGVFDNVSIASGSSTSSALPSGWQARDIGAVGQQGSASHSSGTFTLRGAGADVWGTSDAFHYAYRSLAGDGAITARVASISGTQAWTKMGVMIRGSTTAGSAHAFMLVSSGKGLAFQRRTTNGGTSTHTSGGSGTAPRWVRLARSANVITASVSTNGSTWTVVGRDTFSLASSVLIGLVAHSHTILALATGVFDNVSVID